VSLKTSLDFSLSLINLEVSLLLKSFTSSILLSGTELCCFVTSLSLSLDLGFSVSECLKNEEVIKKKVKGFKLLLFLYLIHSSIKELKR
jgi:hypothetical protein